MMPPLKEDLAELNQLEDSDVSVSSGEVVKDGSLDGCWSWVVCFAAFFVHFCVIGMHYSSGVFFVALLTEFGKSRSKTAWVGAISVFFHFSMCHLASLLCNRWGCRKVATLGACITMCGLVTSSFATNLETLFFTFGVVVGLGTSLCYLPSLIVVAWYFDKRCSFATGITTAGGNVGALVLSPLMNFTIERIGWRNAYRCLAGLCFLLLPCTLLFVRPKDQLVTKMSPEPREKRDRYDLCRNKRYMLLVVGLALANFGYFIPHTHLMEYSKEIGIPLNQGALLIPYMSISSAFGRIAFGKLSDIVGRRTLDMYRICMFLSGLWTVCLPSMSIHYSMLILYVVILGLLDGSFIGLMSVVTFQVAEGEDLSEAWGLILTVESVMMMLGPPAAGLVRDITNEYQYMFYLAAAPMLLGGLCVVAVSCIKPRGKRKDEKYIISCCEEGMEVIYERLTVL